MYSYRDSYRNRYRNRYSYSRFCRKPKRQIRHLPLLPPFAGFCRFLPEISGGKGLRPLPHGSKPGSGPPRRPWLSLSASNGPGGPPIAPRPPPAPAGPASRTGPWDSRPGWSSGSIPNRWKSSPLFAKGGVCRHRRTASFASLFNSLYERDRNMYSYRDRDSYRNRNRNSYSLICYRLLSKSSICLICLRLPGK